MKDRTRWQIVLITGADRDDRRALRGLRWLCKMAWRQYGMTCEVIREAPEETPAETTEA